MIVYRFGILVAILAVSVLAVQGWRWYIKQRFQHIAKQTLPPAIQTLLTTGNPAFLYFTTEQCSQCRFRQSPILAQLQQQSDIHIVTVDAAEQRDIADFYGVMTVPSTVLLDANSRPIVINHGLATVPQLTQQLSTLA